MQGERESTRRYPFEESLMTINLQTSGIHHISLRTGDLDRAKRFYIDVLGLPVIYEAPGLRVDVVLRQGLTFFQQDFEAKFEARNLFGQGYEEFQERGGNIVYYNKYDLGTSFVASITMNFWW